MFDKTVHMLAYANHTHISTRERTNDNEWGEVKIVTDIFKSDERRQYLIMTMTYQYDVCMKYLQ